MIVHVEIKYTPTPGGGGDPLCDTHTAMSATSLRDGIEKALHHYSLPFPGTLEIKASADVRDAPFTRSIPET